MRLHQGFLANRTWPFLAILLCLASTAAYIFYVPEGRRDGSTIMGFALGYLSTAIVVWLAWLGVMKRRFATSAIKRRDKVSAHVWLGLSLIVLVGLHAGWEVGYNIHTLAYLLMIIVVFSGIIGIWSYGSIPRRMNANVSAAIVEKRRPDISDVEQLEQDIADIDTRMERSLRNLPDAFREPVKLSLERTRIGGGLFALLTGTSRGCKTARALRQVRKLQESQPGGEADSLRVDELVEDLTRKAEIAVCLRRDNRYRAFLTLWLWLHIPVTIALIAALGA
ncbi:MAG: hypothetical protein AAGI70_11285, partial [Pseudomonadota bacterium]